MVAHNKEVTDTEESPFLNQDIADEMFTKEDRETCKNCGCMKASHSTGSEYPENSCPPREMSTDWKHGPGTCFEGSGECATIKVVCQYEGDLDLERVKKIAETASRIKEDQRVLDEVCGNCGHRFAYHYASPTNDYPLNYCPGTIGKDGDDFTDSCYENGPGTCFKPTGTYKERESDA